MVSSVLDTLRTKFGLREDVEISMEMDPGTFDAEKMRGMVVLGKMERLVHKEVGKFSTVSAMYDNYIGQD